MTETQNTREWLVWTWFWIYFQLPLNPPYHRTEQMVCFDPKLSEGQPAIASKLMQLYGIKKVRKVGDPGGE